jgi:hypothetical protein
LIGFLALQNLCFAELLMEKQKHLLCLDIGGIGGVSSINYEYNQYWKENITFGISGGFGTVHIRDYRLKFNPDLIFPVAVRLIYGKKHQAEIGVGQTFSSIPKINLSKKNIHTRSADFSTTFVIGYRLQLNKFIFRASYTPIIEKNKHFKHWGGVSIGYAFK